MPTPDACTELNWETKCVHVPRRALKDIKHHTIHGEVLNGDAEETSLVGTAPGISGQHRGHVEQAIVPATQATTSSDPNATGARMSRFIQV
jgi:hypothetical protein